MPERKKIQDVFIRVCRDSGFQLEATRAANLASDALGIHPLQVLTAMGSMEAMERVATGEHPAVQRPTGALNA